MRINCKCHDCGKQILINMPKSIYKIDQNIANTFTCNKCVPENSPARDGINESIYTEAKRKENANDKMIKWLKEL